METSGNGSTDGAKTNKLFAARTCAQNSAARRGRGSCCVCVFGGAGVVNFPREVLYQGSSSILMNVVLMG